MPAFNKDNPDDMQRLDWRILQNGWTSLYYRQTVLNNDLTWFESDGFEIIDIDCRRWTDVKVIHTDLKKRLDFPDYYGHNFDALNDCLSDLEINNSGLIIVFRQFESVSHKNAHLLLDIFADNSRQHILFGKKLLTLVQVDDPNYKIDPIGSYNISWNAEEWLDSNRK